jgi:hypothetical protein
MLIVTPLLYEDVKDLTNQEIEETMLSRIRDIQYLFSEACMRKTSFNHEIKLENYLGENKLYLAIEMRER